MTAGDVAVRLDAVTKRFGKVVALDGMSFEVQRGRLFVVFGPSSVGKTTTLRAIAGLERPQEGRLEINGRDVTRAPIAGRNVSMVFQSFALYPHLTVRENFAYPLKEAGTSAAEIAQRTDEIAEILSLGHRLDNKPETLSGGEQQRVALGRSLIRRPDILLLDEPLTNLDANDPTSGAQIRDHFAYWDDIALHHRGRRLLSSGHGFCGIGRKQLLIILHERAAGLGVDLHFEAEIESPESLMATHDVVIAADGINSRCPRPTGSRLRTRFRNRRRCESQRSPASLGRCRRSSDLARRRPLRSLASRHRWRRPPRHFRHRRIEHVLRGLR